MAHRPQLDRPAARPGGDSLRNTIVGTAAVLLLLFAPIPDGPVRFLGIAAAAVVLWFALLRIWKTYQPDAAAEERVWRALGALIAGLLLAIAYGDLTAQSHVACISGSRTHDGYECFEYAERPGPDLGGALVWGSLAAAAFAFSIRQPKESPEA